MDYREDYVFSFDKQLMNMNWDTFDLSNLECVGILMGV